MHMCKDTPFVVHTSWIGYFRLCRTLQSIWTEEVKLTSTEVLVLMESIIQMVSRRDRKTHLQETGFSTKTWKAISSHWALHSITVHPGFSYGKQEEKAWMWHCAILWCDHVQQLTVGGVAYCCGHQHTHNGVKANEMADIIVKEVTKSNHIDFTVNSMAEIKIIIKNEFELKDDKGNGKKQTIKAMVSQDSKGSGRNEVNRKE